MQRLFADRTDLQERLSLLDPEAVSRAAHRAVTDCSHWTAVREVLLRARDDRRPTLIYGDYDVDGVVATLMLHRWFRAHEVPGNVFLPSRMAHGYGLNLEVLGKAVEHGYRTLIAVDCGTANLTELEYAAGAGLDLAVLDHHEPKSALPAVPVLNAHLESSLPPYCAAGLVGAVLDVLRDEAGEAAAADEAELIALATVADVVPLVPQNWAVAHHGLRALPETTNLGLAELIKVASLHGLTRLTARQASFNLVPRLNAAGRMQSPRLMFDLLAAENEQDARDRALQHDRLNDERRQTADLVTRAALLQSTQLGDSAGVVLYGADWHIGVLGIAAARVAEQLGRPAVVLADAPHADGLISGSARSVGGHNVVDAFEHCTSLLESFGGHALAAGVKLKSAQLEAFRSRFAEAVEEGAECDPKSPPPLTEVSLGELTEQFEGDVWSLAPFGLGHEAPRCLLTGCSVERASYMGRDKTHLNLLVSDGQRQIRIAGFNQSHLLHQLAPGQRVFPAVEILPDNWNNRCSIMLRLLGLEDYAAPGSNQQ
jgi:single-stranded-DNA-specific exonuclease